MKEIDRLRWKFMFYNMLIVTAVIGVTFCCAALLVKKRGRQEINAVLSQAVEYQDLHGRQWQDPEQTRVPHFSVLVQPDGVIVLQDGAYHSFPDQEFLESVVFLGMDGGQETGNLEDYSLRYLRVSGSAGDLIAFADTSYEESMMDEVLLHGGLACCLIWLGFLVLSYFFARWAVRPVEESVRRQKQFVADASHELKTPLTVITANAELLKERCEGMAEDVDKWLDNVDQECIQMRRLVESLLLLARSDLMKKGRKDWERIDLSDLLLEELLTFEPVFYQMGKTIAYESRRSGVGKRKSGPAKAGDPDPARQRSEIFQRGRPDRNTPGALGQEEAVPVGKERGKCDPQRAEKGHLPEILPGRSLPQQRRGLRPGPGDRKGDRREPQGRHGSCLRGGEELLLFEVETGEKRSLQEENDTSFNP